MGAAGEAQGGEAGEEVPREQQGGKAGVGPGDR